MPDFTVEKLAKRKKTVAQDGKGRNIMPPVQRKLQGHKQ